MRKISYSDIDSSNEDNLKDQTLYQENRNLYIKGLYSDNTTFYAQFLPSVIDESTDNLFSIYISPDCNVSFRTKTDENILSVTPTGIGISKEIDMSYQSIVALADPVNPQDAAHKQYVDSKFTQAKEWVVVANTAVSNTAIPIPSQYTTVADWLADAQEGMIVVQDGNDYVSSVVAAKAVTGFPAIFPLHKGGTHLAEFRFQSPTDTTFSVMISNADNVTVLVR